MPRKLVDQDEEYEIEDSDMTSASITVESSSGDTKTFIVVGPNKDEFLKKAAIAAIKKFVGEVSDEISLVRVESEDDGDMNLIVV